MNKTSLILLLILYLLFPAKSLCSEKIKKTVLNNGIVVITKESTANDIVSVKLFLRCGTLYETDDNAGISNIMQRLILKGTRSRSAVDIAKESETIGTKLASSADKEKGIVSLLTIKNNLSKALDLFFDIVKNPSFPEGEVEQEKTQALDEIKKREDIPIRYALDLFEEKYYRKHPYHKPILGYEESVKKFTRKDILDFYQAHYVPNNMVIVSVGNFNTEKFMKEIEKNLGSLTPKDHKELLTEVAFSPPEEESQTLKTRQTKAAWLILGFAAPQVASRDFAAMEVLDSITGGSMNSRLFVEIRDKKGLAYQIGSVYRRRTGPSIYLTYAGTRPDQFEAVREGILQEIKKIKEELVGENELKRTKTYLKGTFIMSQETNSDQANLLGSFELAGLGYDFLKRYPDLIDKVTREEVREAAGKYLTNFTLAAVLPKKESEDRKGGKDENNYP